MDYGERTTGDIDIDIYSNKQSHCAHNQLTKSFSNQLTNALYKIRSDKSAIIYLIEIATNEMLLYC